MNKNVKYHQYIKKFLFIILLISTLGINFIDRIYAEQISVKSYVYSDSLPKNEVEEYEKLMSKTIGGLSFNKIKLTNNIVVDLVGDSAKNIINLPTTYIRPSKAKGYNNITIMDTTTITGITEDQYASALITAGVLDSNISITSDKPIDPVYGLVGVYAAYEESGRPLDKESIQLAQEELKIYKEINNTYGEDKTKLILSAMSEIKYNIQSKISNDVNNINNNSIFQEIESVGKNYNMTDIINKDLLGEYFEKFSHLEFNKEQINSIELFGKEIISSGEAIFKKAKLQWSDLDKDSKNSIIDFLVGLIKSIVEFAIWFWGLIYSILLDIWNLIKDMF